ncbi:Scr1 family TA system antitoxin-like transcriptional regulator [Streptomyces sp. NPDC090106]|uniref:helix-turn-helix domain-containing protein n=1 Tax=Streptomyces sp. NPDC090106 TaxID=3365946 RepID=UPI00381B67F2
MSQPKNLDPASMKEFYGAELRRLREAAGLPQEGLGEQVYCSGAYVGMMEMGVRTPTSDLSQRFDAVLATDGLFVRLCEAIRKASKVAHYFAAAAEMEERALTLCNFASTIVPGALQTPEFTRALVQASRPRVDSEEVERRVAVRQERARALLKDPADPDLWFIVHEASLRMTIGGRSVMCGQLEHIVEVARNDLAVVQVMPFSGGATPLLYGTSTLMTFVDEPPVVYTESAYSGQLVEEPAVVLRYAKSYDLARASALPPEASLAFVEGLLAKGQAS